MWGIRQVILKAVLGFDDLADVLLYSSGGKLTAG
jgi:hypothetical protein